MDKKLLEQHKKRLLTLKQKILSGGLLKAAEDLTVSPDDLADEADLATSVISQQVFFNIRHRELEKLRQIDAALHRISDGTYGMCLDCEEEINHARLETQPWTCFCIVHAEEREREGQKFYRNG